MCGTVTVCIDKTHTIGTSTSFFTTLFITALFVISRLYWSIPVMYEPDLPEYKRQA